MQRGDAVLRREAGQAPIEIIAVGLGQAVAVGPAGGWAERLVAEARQHVAGHAIGRHRHRARLADAVGMDLIVPISFILNYQKAFLRSGAQRSNRYPRPV